MAMCKSCGSEIIWIQTLRGKRMPCDAGKVPYWQKEKGPEKVVTPDGEVVSCELGGVLNNATGFGYVPHWRTCPDAGSFRKGGRA